MGKPVPLNSAISPKIKRGDKSGRRAFMYETIARSAALKFISFSLSLSLVPSSADALSRVRRAYAHGIAPYIRTAHTYTYANVATR